MAANESSPRRLSPEEALVRGRWVKLICGASNQDLPAIADLCAVFATAGVHCVDVAADPAVVLAARQGLDWAETRTGWRPWLMVSLSDGLDIHFRKAWFDPAVCPPQCERPCQRVCPAEAIGDRGAVNPLLCYGCGRCLPACPYGLIEERDHRLGLGAVAELLNSIRPDAIEIHTAPGHDEGFEALLRIFDQASLPLRRLAVSCGLEAHGMAVDELATTFWRRHSHLQRRGFSPLWQLDGRPMSGDVGAGTARSAVELWRAMRSIAPPGPLQLAGGTNHHTLHHLNGDERPAGIAFGGVARRLLLPLLKEAQLRGQSLREWPEGLEQAVALARELVTPWMDRPC